MKTAVQIPFAPRNVFVKTGAFRSVPNSNTWVVRDEVVYVDPWGEVIVVEVGFVTDFASVPSLARMFGLLLAVAALVGRFFPSLRSACLGVCLFSWAVIMMAEWLENSGTDEIAAVHDKVYATRCRSRWKGDLILFHGMVAKGATRNNLAKRLLFWTNVRLAGWWPWIQDAKKRRASK